MQRIVDFESITAFDYSTDVLVCGFGGAGSTAALEARAAGSEVLVLERFSGGGGSTALSACEMYLGGSGGTRLQRDLGFEDTSANFESYLMTAFEGYADPARVRMFVDGAAEHFDWMEAQGVVYKRAFYPHREVVCLTGESLQYTGNERAWPFSAAATPVPRGHLAADAGHDGGKVVMGVLMKRVAESGAQIVCDARVKALLRDSAGRIRGAIARKEGRDVSIRAAQGVVLTAGGFIMNEEMTRRHIPEYAAICTRHGNPGDTGDGILLGVAAGGNAIHMGQAFLCVAHYPPASLTYGIFVNEQGQRFINEDVYLARMGHAAAQQTNRRVFLLIDNEHFERPHYQQLVEIAAVGESIEEVERDAGLPEGALQQTVAFYNAHAARGEDPLFHKAKDWLAPLERGPFALIDWTLDTVRPHCFTLGGLETLPTGEVLTVDGDAIPGLYAAGRTACGIPRTSQGYASGMSVADATFFGRRAGRQAAAQPRV